MQNSRYSGSIQEVSGNMDQQPGHLIPNIYTPGSASLIQCELS